ncbi:glycosyltransferase 87 family protein [Propionicimonas sp.]|uniref:glycosyltransferase family 87 protein n=1 Tax=Propionicimonas sp. TaxID=1955623 RepID=UPI0039E4A84E
MSRHIVLVAAYLALAAAILWHIIQTVIDPSMRWTMIDMQVFREASLSAFAGNGVYDGGFTSASLPFLYPPFALLALWPIAAIPLLAAKIAMSVINLAALGVLCWRSAAKTVSRVWIHPLTIACAAVLLVSEPMQQNLQMGQVNAIIAAIALLDFTLPDNNRWKGALTGAMAGVKLTPALLAVYYLVSGQRRAALNSGASFVATIALSWALFPRNTLDYWTSTVFQSRIGPAHLGNQALLGVTDRAAAALGWNPRLVGFAWVIVVLGVVFGALRQLRRSRLGDVATFGALSLTILLVSPLSWTPHWISAAPLLVWAASRRPTIKSAAAVLLAVGLALFAWPVDGVPSGLIWFVYPGGFAAPDAPWWHSILYWTLGAFYTIGGVIGLIAMCRAARASSRPSSQDSVPYGQAPQGRSRRPHGRLDHLGAVEST